MPSRRAPRAAAGVALLLMLLLAAGCGTVKSPTEPPSASGGGAAFTFSQIQREIFTPTCAKAGCHAAATASEGLVLDAGQSYALLVGHPASEQGSLARVEPGSPERSYLILKLRGDPSISGQRMPQDGPPFLTADQIDGIAGWIRAGAPRN